MITLGVDCGLTGAVAFIDERGACTVEDLPTVALPGNGMIRRRIDGRALANLILRCTIPGEPVEAFVESVSTMGGALGNAVQTQGSLMRTLGAVETVLEMLRMPPTMVVPRTWKRVYGLDSSKADTLTTARKLYPETALRSLARAKDHNRADAVLIAHYGRIKKELIG